MNVPKGWTEAEVLKEIESIVRLLAPSFKFGCYTLEDIKQEARLYGLECLPRYDPSRKLAGFLYSHIRNRLNNLRRNEYYCGECPCKLCKGRNDGCTKHDDKAYCEEYRTWIRKNARKQGVVVPNDIGCVDDEKESAMWFIEDLTNNAFLAQILEKIDRELPIAMRSTYLKMQDNVKGVPKNLREQVINKIKEIIGEESYA